MNRRVLGLGLLVATVTALVWVIVPVFLIRPFSPQTPAGLELAYTLRSSGTAATATAFALGLGLAVLLWRGIASRTRRGFGVAALLLLSATAWFATQNHFEWMFQPLEKPRFAGVAESDHVGEDELVLGVAIGGEARAYPVRALAYHHLVDDVVGGGPITVTY